MTVEKKENHKTRIVQVTETLPIKDADKIELVKFGLPYQCVSQKGTFKKGDLAVYIQPDSVVPCTAPFEFIWKPYAQPTVWTTDEKGGSVAQVFPIPDKRRRITVRKMRGEWSEGLLLPVSDFPELMENRFDGENDLCFFNVGDDVSDILRVTHYQPADDEGQQGFKPLRKAKRPKTFKGWVFFLLHKLRLRRQEPEQLDYPKYDVDALKSQTHNPFHGSEIDVVITEKIHGSSARFVFLDGVMYAGSRNLWLSAESTGHATAALKANPQIERWCRANEGFALYGEVSGTQKGFNYGKKGHQFWLFDIRTAEGRWLDYEDPLYFTAFAAKIESVPLLYKGEYSESIVKQLIDGKSIVGDHIREGIVIKLAKERLGRRAQFKIVSNDFLQKDSK
jgi:hypothetical protein